VLCTRGRAEWLDHFEVHQVPAGPINTVADVVADRHLVDRGLFYSLQGRRPIPQVGTGVHLNGFPNGRTNAPPALGADTDLVLSTWAGMCQDDVAELRRRGVV
jgi:crotonobetainyl-CoA:carnitine CoA-transferase CaiB-like acyl-CoA transferase